MVQSTDRESVGSEPEFARLDKLFSLFYSLVFSYIKCGQYEYLYLRVANRWNSFVNIYSYLKQFLEYSR